MRRAASGGCCRPPHALDRPTEDLEDCTAEGPPIGGDWDAREDVMLAAAELGRLVELGQRLLGHRKVLGVRIVRLHEELEAAELPIHATVDKERGHAHLPVQEG